MLFLACHLPFPPLSGGRRRELELLKRLARRCDVHLMVVSKTFDQDAANAHRLEEFCERVEVFPAEPLPQRPRAGDKPFHVLRHHCPAMTRRVAEVLPTGGYDVVHVEGFYLMQHLPAEPGAPVLLVEQNIEYDLERQRASHAARPALDDLRTQHAEVDAWRRADLLGVLTAEDREMLLAALPGARVRIVPDGADHLPPAAQPVPEAERPAGPLLAFVANFGYAPNVDAAIWLCDDILPAIRTRIPDVNLWLVGTDPPPDVRALAGDAVRVTGRVDEVTPYIDAADVIVCPLRVGGGIKVKAIEALRRGKAVVSTTIGAQGIPPAAAGAIAICDDAGDFAARAADLLADAGLRSRAERRSVRAGLLLATWDDAAGALLSAYDELLEEQPAKVAAGA